jgi:hypothetical protein
MTYNQQDISSRIGSLLPNRWFGSAPSVLKAVLNSLAAGWISFFNLLSYTASQSRITTSFDFWLDLVSRDFFGYSLSRRSGESDNSFKTRIEQALLRDRCTRAAIYQCLIDVTNNGPVIFEPTSPLDTGCYAQSLSSEYMINGYGMAGGWGSLGLPFQAFVKAFRPVVAGISMVSGWCGDVGAFGGGVCAYASGDITLSQVSDAEIYQSISQTAPAGCTIWTLIE